MTPPSPGAVSPPRAATRVAEPAGFWIRYTPRGWPAPDRPWLDLGRGTLGAASGGAGALPEPAGAPFDDVLWLPPVPDELAGERDRLAAGHLAAGTPVLVGLVAGQAAAVPGAVPLVDPLAALLAEDAAVLAEVPAGAAVAWPLVAGLTDRPELVAAGLEHLAAAGAGAVQATVPRLEAAARRRLADHAGDPEAFDRLFHGPEPDERAFARAAARQGFDVFLARPLPRAPLGGAGNRRLAEVLYLAAELWLRLGRSPEAGQALFRAARWVDESGYDLEALAREGNLGVVAAIDARSRELLEATVASGGEPELLAALRRAYTGDEEIG